jgi:hydroxyacylglutathione hydrolase
MAHVVEVNRGPLVREEPRAALVEQVPAGAVLLDVRDAEAFAGAHVRGSLNVAVGEPGFATRVAFVVPLDADVVLLASGPPQAAAATRALAAVGFTRLLELAGGASSPAVGLVASFHPIAVDELAASVDAVQVVDVREPDEQDVLAPGALAVPYRSLPDADLSLLDRDAPVATICQSGVRAAVAASLLERRGFRDVRPVLHDGMGSWPLAGR